MCAFGYLSIAAAATCGQDQLTLREKGGHGYQQAVNRDGPVCSCSARAFSTTQAPRSVWSQAFLHA